MADAILEQERLAAAQALAVAGQGPAYLPPFAHSQLGSMGIELELMVLDRLTYDLMPAAPDILRLLDMQRKKWIATPEITTSMLEVASSILGSYAEAAAEIEEIRSSVQQAAFRVGAAISGGGAHPFQKWNEQRIYPKERYRESAKKYGYLAKMFTVFGMHVHIGVPSADEAVRLCAWLTQRAPLFIALSANSPCWQGEESGFCSARSNVVGAFPMSGTMPAHIRTWHDFERHFARLAGHGIVNSIKDFYWDVRPKPEFGTIELRVLDTPLHPSYAAALACYARELCIEAFEAPGTWPLDDSRELYAWNRFNAAKDGVEANWINPCTGVGLPVRQVVMDDLERLARRSPDPGFGLACRMIGELMRDGGQARWLTAHLDAGSGMNDLSRVASEMFERPPAGALPAGAPA
ncbi:YbdK family carboxylate-amine ligase [Massilia pseudoviolaceinigra]|uniref:YbdK family carboxylate-amine ligase n=1 Tax=Massilia pseudoviolaceinigra TaxID=3057165 RepID=UPI0027963CEF|nr:YbdK family carboxylate-amine ligase [Massilia sp. CCM 9206]MDQ1921556.1 YbdK family carboxylate-amine ligase [Massilia sp. CCM 9206]